MYAKIDLQLRNSDALLKQIRDTESDAIILSSWFKADDLSAPEPGEVILAESTRNLLRACSDSLAVGGLMFIYGSPHRLPAYAAELESLADDEAKYEFKYWIGIQLNQSDMRRTLHQTHVGLLVYHKVSRELDTPFNLNNRNRIPHSLCTACGKNVRDWGGKTHLINPYGSAISDVWTDLSMRPIAGNRMPGDVLRRVRGLANGAGDRTLHIVEAEPSRQPSAVSRRSSGQPGTWNLEPGTPLTLDTVETADCVAYMESLLPEYENRAFDLVFADPPYNLDKLYENYRDACAAEQYLAWCDKWLELCARLLKPGGSLFVVNLPKWALYHARTLDKHMDVRHWIVWQALAEPRGKLLPAHYSLLYYTKPGEKPVVNYQSFESRSAVGLLDSPEYCLRAGCIKKRKGQGDDKKVPLTDVWWDIYRIRHKRDRDYHPCQLPEKLLERVITLASNPGQVVFDPLCGVGTTAVVAKRLGRRYVTVDIDSAYVDITRKKLALMEDNLQQNGECRVPRTSIRREPKTVTKKQIESMIQQLARDLGRMPDMEDVRMADSSIYEEIRKIYSNPRKALAAARLVFAERAPEVEV